MDVDFNFSLDMANPVPKSGLERFDMVSLMGWNLKISNGCFSRLEA